MEKNLLIFLLLFPFYFCSVFNNTVATNFLKGISAYFFEKGKDVIEKVSEECQKDLHDAYDFEGKNESDYSYFYIHKIIFCSYQFNILSKYDQCLSKVPNINLTADYYMAIINNRESNNTNYTVDNLKMSKLFFGFCLPEKLKCSELEINSLIQNLYEAVQEITTVKMTKSNIYRVKRDPLDINKYIPLIIFAAFLLIQVIIIVFNLFPFSIYKKMFRQEYKLSTITKIKDKSEKNLLFTENIRSESLGGDELINKEENGETTLLGFQQESMENVEEKLRSNSYIAYEYNMIEYTNFYSSLTLGRNIDDLFDNHSKACLNYTGLTYIFGMRGLAIFPYIFGIMYFVVINSIPSSFNQNTYSQLTKNILFGFVSFGIRYSPKIFLSCSGYCLFYKFVCFLDDCYEGMQEKKRKRIQEEEEENPIKVEDLSKDDYDDEDDYDSRRITSKKKRMKDTNVSAEEHINEEIFIPKLIKYKFLFIFYFYQLPKYVVYVLLLFFIKYCIFQLVYLIRDNDPFWQYCYDSIFNIKIGHFLRGIFLIHGMHTGLINDDERENFLNYFFLPIQEILFFLLTSFFIFLGYKYQIRITSIFTVIIAIYMLTKFLLFLLDIPKNLIRNTQLFQIWENYGEIFYHPLYNYPYYLIGTLFGGVNYLIQKGIYNRKQVEDGQKQLLHFSLSILLNARKNSKIYIFFLTLFGLGATVCFAWIQTIFEYFGDFDYKETILNLILLIDADIIIIVLHYIMLELYIKANTFSMEILGANFWLFTEKLYFIFIMMSNFMSIYVFYQNESENYVTLAEVALYGTFAAFLSFVGSLFGYIFIEEPWRKLNKKFTENIIGKY
ncbi:MAG: hypothetical protein MJ252_07470 [archaeon]|nr:hypothetical protein [archaeon]